MSRISRAGDSLWTVSAFDPRKPFDPDWAEKPPKPILRSPGDEYIFADGPQEHHQGTDAMTSSGDSVGADESEFEDQDDYNEPDRSGTILPGGEFAPGTRADVPAHDLEAIGRHARRLRGAAGSTPIGSLQGNDPRGPMAQYYNDSNVAHYYTYNPHDRDGGRPWVVNTTHWELREPLSTRAETFEQAAIIAKQHKAHLKYNLGID